MAPPPATPIISGPLDVTPGAVHWAIALVLIIGLASGFLHVGRALRKVDMVGIALRNVPEGMRTAQCGACHRLQYISTQGRVFVCYSCHAANRIPRNVLMESQQLLFVNTGPLRGYEFKKGGDNYWQELRQEELPELELGDPNIEAEKLHYRGSYCWGCAQDNCKRLSEFPQDAKVANLVPLEADFNPFIQPEVIGNQVDCMSETESAISKASKSTTYQGLRQCVVCLDGPGRMVLLPCQHGSVCEECATRIAQNQASGGARCPHCRASIERLVKITQVTGDFARGVEVRIPIARTMPSMTTAGASSAAASPASAMMAGSPGSPTPLLQASAIERPGSPGAASQPQSPNSVHQTGQAIAAHVIITT